MIVDFLYIVCKKINMHILEILLFNLLFKYFFNPCKNFHQDEGV